MNMHKMAYLNINLRTNGHYNLKQVSFRFHLSLQGTKIKV